VTALGIYGLSVGKEVSNLVSLGMPTLVLIVGMAVVIVSGLGLYAAFSESPGLLRFVSLKDLMHIILTFDNSTLAR
jgi:hypothetical protein